MIGEWVLIITLLAGGVHPSSESIEDFRSKASCELAAKEYRRTLEQEIPRTFKVSTICVRR